MNKFIFNFFLIFLYKFLSILVYIFKKNKLNNFNNINLIIFNRTDRIGDAILSLPFFLSLKEKKINFIVLTSKYNDWVLNPFVKTKIREKNFLNEKPGSFFSILKTYFTIFNFKKNNLISGKYYIDLKGDYYLDDNFNDFYKIHLKNSYLNFKYSNYIFNDYYAYLSKINLVDKYSNLFEKLFDKKLNLEELPFDLLEKIRETNIINNFNLKKYISKDYIIILCANKKFKNLSIENWIYFLNNINYKSKILIVDDPNKLIINQLKEFNTQLNNLNNIIFIEEEFNLWELSYLSYNSNYLIGLDGGAFNFLQFFTNSIDLMFYSNHIVWRGFSLNKYNLIYNQDSICIEKSIQKNKNKKIIIYNKKYNDSPYYEFYKINVEVYSKKDLKNILSLINFELNEM